MPHIDPLLIIAGAAAGLFATLWRQVTSLTRYARNVLFDTRVLDQFSSMRVEDFLEDNARRFSSVPAVYSLAYYSTDMEQYTQGAYDVAGEEALFLWGKRPVWLKGNRSGRTVTTLRRGNDLDRLLVAANEYSVSVVRKRVDDTVVGAGRFRVETLQGDAHNHYDNEVAGSHPDPGADAKVVGRDGALGAVSSRPIIPLGCRLIGGLRPEDVVFVQPGVGDAASLAITPEGEAFLEDARRWYLSQKWYRERGIPWRRGWRFHGGPGTGKTTLAVAAARMLGLPVFVLDLSSMTNRCFVKNWDLLKRSSPCFAVVEDVDGVYHGRDLVDKNRGPSWDLFLNTIGGASVADGVFLVVTTNKPELCDEALCVVESDGRVSRPGRVDRDLEFFDTTYAQRVEIADRVLDAQDDETRERVVDEGDGDTVIQFVNRCRDLALGEYWELSREKPQTQESVR